MSFDSFSTNADYRVVTNVFDRLCAASLNNFGLNLNSNEILGTIPSELGRLRGAGKLQRDSEICVSSSLRAITSPSDTHDTQAFSILEQITSLVLSPAN